MFRPRQLVSLLGLALVAGAFASSVAFAARNVHIDLVDKADGGMAMTASAQSVKAGRIAFAVTNKSKDNRHEFLVAPLAMPLGKIPYDDTNGRIKEAALKGVHELGDLDPGKSGTMTLDLKPGKYLLFCNLPGHYKEGMYDVLTVTK